MSPVVSIIMPTFNRLEFLKPAIDSVFAQTFEDWELIVADDGSSEPARAYLAGLQDHPRVRVVWLPHTGKPSLVSNVAIRAARGEYVAFLDSDDVWLPKKLEIQIASLRQHPERGWGYTKFALIDASGNRTDPARTRNWPTPSGWILERLLVEETVIAQPSVIVARRLLAELGAFDETLVMCYDDELWFRLAAHSEIDGVDEPLTLVRRHGQHSGSDIIAWRDRRRVFEKALRVKHGPRLDAMLRKLRARMSAGLATSQAVSGRRWDAFATLCLSAAHSWRDPGCWVAGWASTLRACVPRSVRTLARRYRGRRQLARL
jgi:glycosyltransferase involved in cell wall biosynthesis